MGNLYYLVRFVNFTKLGTVLIETVLNKESLYEVTFHESTARYHWALSHSIFLTLRSILYILG